jgi:hypothetical protein
MFIVPLGALSIVWLGRAMGPVLHPGPMLTWLFARA